jgi:hypothetical protein
VGGAEGQSAKSTMMSASWQDVESRVGGEEGGAVGDGTECAFIVFLILSASGSSTVRRWTYLPFRLWLHESMRALGSQCKEIGGAVASLEELCDLGLLGRDCSDRSGVETCEACSGITVKVSCTA